MKTLGRVFDMVRRSVELDVSRGVAAFEQNISMAYGVSQGETQRAPRVGPEFAEAPGEKTHRAPPGHIPKGHVGSGRGEEFPDAYSIISCE